ncbi:MAG: hypothetical protein NUW00_01485 [Candidatus Kaiserbacteria bacterium]|nr:hypothetical protein [Candidatus Kaiserbacteria bacterium]
MNRVELLAQITRAGITGSEHSGVLCKLLLEHFPAPQFVVRRKNVYSPMWHDRAYIASVYRVDGVTIVHVPRWKFGPFQSREVTPHEVLLETYIATVTLGVVSLVGCDPWFDLPEVYSSHGVSISGWNSIAMGSLKEATIA